MKEITITKLIDYLRKNNEEFKNAIYDEEFVQSLIAGIKGNNIKEVVRHIKLDENMGEGNILNNLLLLDPISLPILDSFIKSDYLDKEDFCCRVDKVRQISSGILESLREQKLKIRKGCASDINNIQDSEEQLNNVIDELKKHEDKLMFLEEKREKNKELDKVKSKISKLEKELESKNIDELNEKVKYYESKKLEIDKIKEEILSSKKMFNNLPNDEA